MRACTHADGANLLGVEAALLCLAANHSDRSLSVLPSALVDGQTFGSRRTIDEVDALEAEFREALRPKRDEVVVAGVEVAAARDENHAAAVRCLRFLHPFQVGHSGFVGIEAFGVDFGRHSRNLLRLSIGHFAFRPDGNVLSCLNIEECRE